MVLSMLIAGVMAQSSCLKDTDCKGDRICESGACVAPERRPPPPDSFPRVVHIEGQICVQSLDAQGQVEQSCRPEVAEPAPPPPPPPEKARSRFSADLLVNGGVMALIAGSETLALPQITAYAAFGGRTFVVVTNASLGFNAYGAILALNLAPGLHLGSTSHVVLSAGPTLIAGGFGGQTFAGLAGSVLLQGVISVLDGLVITPQGGFHFDASGFLLTAGVGIGWSTL